MLNRFEIAEAFENILEARGGNVGGITVRDIYDFANRNADSPGDRAMVMSVFFDLAAKELDFQKLIDEPEKNAVK